MNMPESATVEEVERDLLRGLEARPEGPGHLPRQLQGRPAAVDRQEEGQGDGGPGPVPAAPAPHEYRPVRKRLPRQRSAIVTRFSSRAPRAT